MRPYQILLPVLLVLAFTGVSFAALCGGVTPCACGDTLNESYTMTSDLTGCAGNGLTINIAVTLDCDGYEIAGTGGALSNGIDANGPAIVENCNVSGFYYGIDVGWSNATLLNNTVHNNTYGLNAVSPSFGSAAVATDTHLYDNNNDFNMYLGSTDGSVILFDAMFDNDNGNFENYTSIEMRPTPFYMDNTVTMDHSDPIGGPTGYVSFGNRYVNITAGFGGTSFDSINWTWGSGEDDAGVKLYRTNDTFNWEEVPSTLDTVNNRLNVSSHTLSFDESYIYGLFQEGPQVGIPIYGCTELNESGYYVLEQDFTISEGTYNGATDSCTDTCIIVTADDVLLNLQEHTITVEDTSSGFCVMAGDGVSGFRVIDWEIPSGGSGGGAWIIGGTAGVVAIGAAMDDTDSSAEYDTEIDPITFCNLGTGVLLNNASNTILDEVIVCNNSQYGFHIIDSDNVTINASRAYNNSVDLLINNTLGSPVTFNITSLILDNPAGNLQNYTEIYLDDSVSAGSAYSFNWTAQPGALPAGYVSFEGKFVDINALTGTVSFDSISWHYTDSELTFGGYNESLLTVQVWNGSAWADTGATHNTGANTFTLTSYTPASEYGILHNGTTGYFPTDLYGVNLTNITHHGRFTNDTVGSNPTEGGNITGVEVRSAELTERWAAFYGDVIGEIVLRGATGSNYVYSWAWNATNGGVVCLSTNSSITTFTAYPANGGHIDTAWSFSTSADAGAVTFNETNCSLDIGAMTIDNTSYADTGAAGGFITCAIKTTGSSTPVKNEMIFCSEIISGGTVWDGSTGDFEVIVPTPYSPGSTETYYFYANLD